MQKLYGHSEVGEVLLFQSRQLRRITLSVRPSGVVRLSFPSGISQVRALEFLESKITWIVAARSRMAARQAAMPQLPEVEQKARVDELRRAAKIDLPSRTERLASELGLRCGRVTIRASKSKWGSCTSRNDLSLSLFLMTLPEHLRDYVIVHELCHTVHHNHSPRFHALVDQCLGGREKALSRELKGYTIRG